MALTPFSLYSYYLCTWPLTLNCELSVRKDRTLFISSPPLARKTALNRTNLTVFVE